MQGAEVISLDVSHAAREVNDAADEEKTRIIKELDKVNVSTL